MIKYDFMDDDCDIQGFSLYDYDDSEKHKYAHLINSVVILPSTIPLYIQKNFDSLSLIQFKKIYVLLVFIRALKCK